MALFACQEARLVISVDVGVTRLTEQRIVQERLVRIRDRKARVIKVAVHRDVVDWMEAARPFCHDDGTIERPAGAKCLIRSGKPFVIQRDPFIQCHISDARDIDHDVQEWLASRLCGSQVFYRHCLRGCEDTADILVRYGGQTSALAVVAVAVDNRGTRQWCWRFRTEGEFLSAQLNMWGSRVAASVRHDLQESRYRCGLKGIDLRVTAAVGRCCGCC